MDEPDPQASAADSLAGPGAASKLRLIGWCSAGLGMLRAAMTTACTCFVAMSVSALLCAVFGWPAPHPDDYHRRGSRMHYELDLRDLGR